MTPSSTPNAAAGNSRVAPPDLLRIVLAVLVIALLILSSFWILRPFLPALIWAAMIVVSTWKLMLILQARLMGSRTLAVIAMTGVLILLLLLPLTIAITTLLSSGAEVGERLQRISSEGLPPAPSWFDSVPLVGERLVKRWQQLRDLGQEDVLVKIRPYFGAAATWALAQLGGFGEILIHFFLTVILSAVLFAKGESAGQGIRLFARKLADDRGERAVILASQAIRAVASGVIITAIIQAAMTAFGLALAGVPYTVILSSLTFFLCVVQIGAGPVLIGSTIWLFYTDGGFVAWAFLVWAIITIVADNFVRPFLIKRGADLPILLIFAGVIGGLLAFGIIGIFIGPVVLAICYTLGQSWINGDDQVGERA